MAFWTRKRGIRTPAGSASHATRARPRRRPGRPLRRGRERGIPLYLIALGVAVAASTSAAQKRAVALLSAPDAEGTDPLPQASPDWLKRSPRARRLWTVANRVVLRMGNDNLTLVAAGIAFYAMFAIFPAMGALVSIYGLFGDTHTIQAQVQQVAQLLPRETSGLLLNALNGLVAKPNTSLNSGLAISLALAIWGARAGIASLMAGLNVALERREQRSFLVQNLVAIGLTFGAIAFAIFALGVVAVIPLVLDILPVDETLRAWLAYSRWPVMGLFILVSLDVVYRFAPSHTRPQWHLVSVGTMFAGVLWILGSWIFSAYVTRFGSYDATYGSLGAVIVLLLWFWLSALIVLLGATIDSVRADMRRAATA